MKRGRFIVVAVLISVCGLLSRAFADTSTSIGDRGGEGSTVFTGLAQTPEANLFTGASATSVPIDIPPGRKNLTPTLALLYSSAGGPSPYGFGWDLPLGRIQRSTKTGVPRCDWHTDDFVLTLPSGTVELIADPPGGSTYRPKVEESYLQVTKDEGANSWVAYDASGLKYTFGDTASARTGNDTSVFMSPGPPCRFTTTWGLTKVEDTNGNTILTSYTNISNVLYPVNIQYGGNSQTGLAHFYFVKFTYETRPDAVESDLSGATAVLRLRLSLIRVATNVPSYSEFRTYTLTYDNPANGPSMLSSVAVTGYPNTQLFTYADSLAGHASESYTPPSGWTGLRTSDTMGNVTRTVMDMNGDGYIDLIQTWGAGSWIYYKGGPNGPSTSGTSWTASAAAMDKIRAVRTNAVPCQLSAGTTCTERDTFDINGDGIPDFVDARTTPWTVYLGNGQGFNGATSWAVPESKIGNTVVMTPIREDFHPQTGSTVGETQTFHDVVDINGDGLPDLVYSGDASQPLGLSSYTWTTYLNTGSGFSLSPITFTAPFNMLHRESPASVSLGSGTITDLMDFNGDGLLDIVTHPKYGNSPGYDMNCITQQEYESGFWKLCLDVYSNTGQGFNPVHHIPIPNTDWTIRSRDGYNNTYQDLLDVNGDGLPDYVYADRSQPPTWPWSVLLNQGGTLEPFTVTLDEYFRQFANLRPFPGGRGAIRLSTTGGNPNTLVDVLDFDGDGMLDHVDTRVTPWNFYRNRNFAQNRAKPNALTMMKNGLGGLTTLIYTPSSRFDNTGGDYKPDLPFVTWVTTGIRQTDGLCDPGDIDVFNRLQNLCITSGNELISTFTYQDGRFDGPTREFRGFRKVFRTNTTTTVQGNVVASTFGQTYEAKGKVLNVDTYGGTSQFVRRVVNIWNTATIGTGRTQLWLASNQVLNDDLNPGNNASTLTYNDQPDAYGNVRHTYRTDIAGTTRVDTYTEYVTTPSGTHVYDKPWRVYSTYTRPGQGTVEFERKWFFYDGLASQQLNKGNVTAVESWLNPFTGSTAPPTCTVDGAKQCVRTTMTYDSYGNIATVTDALGGLTTTTYDDGYGKFLYPYQVKRRVTASPLFELTTTALTDYKWGKPTSVTDPNNAPTSYSYDTAGRPTCATLPGDASCSMKYTYAYASQFGEVSAVGVEHKEPNQTSTYPNQPDAGYVTTTRYFDALGRTRHTAGFRVVDGANQTIIADRVEYDAAGRVAKRYDPYPLSPSTDARTPNPGTPNNGFATYEYMLNGSVYYDPLGVCPSNGENQETFEQKAFDARR
jgi:YD repeat-containing protein